MTCYVTLHNAELNCVVSQPKVPKSQLHVLMHQNVKFHLHTCANYS